ncbi:hypothetical protein GCM10022399_18160 [Terrabacter ginsenosidimutans]|uniref:HNH endonuclease n=1 Tax=Terrabacter ginsenosidimutans TaxID=490575 RepID=A0ABP7DBM0_9MICO
MPCAALWWPVRSCDRAGHARDPDIQHIRHMRHGSRPNFPGNGPWCNPPTYGGDDR